MSRYLFATFGSGFSMLLLGATACGSPRGAVAPSECEARPSAAASAPQDVPAVEVNPNGSAKDTEPRGVTDAAAWRRREEATSGADAVVEFNAWAQRVGTQDDLLAMVVFGLPVPNDVDAKVDVDYERGESPKQALVTVTLDGWLDDSVRGTRYVLEFGKEACPECSSKSHWVLRSRDESWRCYPGRGHEDFSKAPCN